ncbi:APC family permease [Spiroplasma sp. AdecLV25b]|uniref:APC family permease n=1 Tax=Spiroplasma sp. AdecLV25b TaxID=3027162 RepID=UPI0035A6C75B
MGITVMVLLALTHIFIKNSSGISQIIFTTSKFIPVSIVILVALIYGTTHSFTSEHSNANSSMGTILLSQFLLIPAIATTMFAFSGMESVTYMAGEVKKPQQNIFKALLWATIVVVALYVILLIVLLAIADPSKWADSNGSYTNVWFTAIMNSPNIPKAWAYTFSTLTIFVFLGSLNAHLFYQARLVQKIALEKDLFSFFTKTSSKTHTPYTALGLIVFLAIIYMMWNELFSIMTYGVLANTILKFIGIGFSTKLRYGNYGYKRLFSNFWYFTFLIISTIGFFVCVIGSLVANYWLAQSEHNMWVFWKLIIVVVAMFLGYPLYYLKLYINKLQVAKKATTEVVKLSTLKNIEGI